MLLAFVLACAPKPVFTTAGDAPRPSELRRDGVALAPVVVVADLPAPVLPSPAEAGVVEQGLQDPTLQPPTVLDPERDGDFIRNDYLGNVRFGGGFIRTGTLALDVRARLIEFNFQDPYRTQGVAWLGAAVTELLDERGLAPLPFDPGPVGAERVPVRGIGELDGRDNTNLPRSTLTPSALPGPVAGAPARWLLVPFLRAYYTHNGGWFVGQEYGCLAGARTEVTLALYDTSTGRPAWWTNATGRHVSSRVGQPSTAELDQYLLWAEADAAEALERGFLR